MRVKVQINPSKEKKQIGFTMGHIINVIHTYLFMAVDLEIPQVARRPRLLSEPAKKVPVGSGRCTCSRSSRREGAMDRDGVMLVMGDVSMGPSV